jgi:hypothetical protein
MTKYDTISFLLCGGDNLSVMPVSASSLLLSPGEKIDRRPRVSLQFQLRTNRSFCNPDADQKRLTLQVGQFK